MPQFGPAGLEPSTGARNKRKATVKTQSNRQPRILPLIQVANLLNIYKFDRCPHLHTKCKYISCHMFPAIFCWTMTAMLL